MFPPFPLLSKVIQKLRTTQEGEVILTAPLVTISTVVPTSTTSVCGPPSHHSVPPGPTFTTGMRLGRQVVPSARLKALMQHYQTARFSKEVSTLAASRRKPLTNRIYDRWQVASFLSRTDNAVAVQAKIISDVITSMDLQRPRMTTVQPQWDLGIVLEALSKPPYEALPEASLKHLTLKTGFLLGPSYGSGKM